VVVVVVVSVVVEDIFSVVDVSEAAAAALIEIEVARLVLTELELAIGGAFEICVVDEFVFNDCFKGPKVVLV
jgi:hypothetical protein